MVAVLCLALGSAEAGYKYSNGIYISPTYIQGPIGGTRNTADNVSRVYVQIDATATWQQAFVWVQDSAGSYKYCFTSNPQMVQAIANAPSDAFVYAYIDVNNTCTRVTFVNGSMYEPKLP